MSVLFTDYQTIRSINQNRFPCQLPCFFMRLGMGSSVQLIDTLPFSQKPSCQLVRKLPQEWNPWRFAIKYLLDRWQSLPEHIPGCRRVGSRGHGRGLPGWKSALPSPCLFSEWKDSWRRYRLFQPVLSSTSFCGPALHLC